MLTTLLTIGSCLALGAFIFSLKLNSRRRSISAFALFVAMLSLLLYSLYPGYERVLGTLAIVAAGVYAVLAIKERNARRGVSSDDSDKGE